MLITQKIIKVIKESTAPPAINARYTWSNNAVADKKTPELLGLKKWSMDKYNKRGTGARSTVVTQTFKQ